MRNLRVHFWDSLTFFYKNPLIRKVVGNNSKRRLIGFVSAICLLLCFATTCFAWDANKLTTPDDSIARDSVAYLKYDNDTYDYRQRYFHNDTLWFDDATGRRVHLQRLSVLDSLVTPNKLVIWPVLESLGINFGVWAWDCFVADHDWARVNGHVIKENLKSPFVLDYDSYSGNQFSHPFHGSMFFNAARYHGHSYYTAAVYPLIGSVVWEYFCETNKPAFNDFLSTGIGGSAIGEATFRTSDIIFDNSKRGFVRVIRELVGTALNPTRGLHRLISGESWRYSPARGKRVQPEPFSLDVGLGSLYAHELRHRERSKRNGYVEFLLNYGDPFMKRGKRQPFDVFTMHLNLNISGHNPTFSLVDIRGRLFGKTFNTSKDWMHDLAVHQTLKYIDSYGDEDEERPGDYALVNEACSFGVGLYSKKNGPKWSYFNNFLLNAVAFGGTTADYFQGRRYNFASGFSIHNDQRITLNRILSLSHDIYYAFLMVPKGPADPADRGDYNWGDKGVNNVFIHRIGLAVNLRYHFKLKVERNAYYRISNYHDFDHVRAKSFDIRFGLLYSM